jgi:hypothetical protein
LRHFPEKPSVSDDFLPKRPRNPMGEFSLFPGAQPAHPFRFISGAGR